MCTAGRPAPRPPPHQQPAGVPLEAAVATLLGATAPYSPAPWPHGPTSPPSLPPSLHREAHPAAHPEPSCSHAPPCAPTKGERVSPATHTPRSHPGCCLTPRCRSQRRGLCGCMRTLQGGHGLVRSGWVGGREGWVSGHGMARQAWLQACREGGSRVSGAARKGAPRPPASAYIPDKGHYPECASCTAQQNTALQSTASCPHRTCIHCMTKERGTAQHIMSDTT